MENDDENNNFLNEGNDFDDDSDLDDLSDLPPLGFLEDPHKLYNNTMNGLHQGSQDLNLSMIAIVLENIDVFCGALAEASLRPLRPLRTVNLFGSRVNAEGPRLEISEENANTWNKLFLTLGSIESIDELVLIDTVWDFGPTVLTKLIQSMQKVTYIELHFPLCILPNEVDMHSFVDALSLHPCNNVRVSNFQIPEEDLADPGNIFEAHHGFYDSLFSELNL